MHGCASSIVRAVVAFLDAVLVDCFLSCFRARRRPGAVAGSSCRDALVLRDQDHQVQEVLSDDEQGRTAWSAQGLDNGGSVDVEELIREANYLKLCGTISETPVELQKESCECEINIENVDECNSMLTTSANNCTFLLETNSSEGCITEEHYISSHDLKIEDTHDLPRAGSIPHSPFLEKNPFLYSRRKQVDGSASPAPTPSVLRDDMQTPGTIYTSHRGALMSGKRVRTRKQFIYPVLRPIENKVQHMEPTKDTSPYTPVGTDSIKKPMQTSSSSVATPGLSKFPPFPDNSERLDGGLAKSNTDEKHSASSLSQWLRPSFADNENQGDVKCAMEGHSYDDCSFLTERAVFVASDLNWDVENSTPRLPKKWDGNGIPNTNTKYKEDKKVTWHTTPFDERLKRFLSDAEVLPAKVARGKLFHHEERS